MSTAVESHDVATHHYNLGVQYEKEKNLEQARNAYERALEEDPDFPYPYKALGEIYYNEGNAGKAHKNLRIALKLDPEWVEVMALLARIYLDEGETEKAMEYQEMALKRDPDNLTYNALYGRMLVAAKRYTEAIEVLEKVELDDPNNFQMHYYLGVAYGKRAMEYMDRSHNHWERARVLEPDDPLVYRNLGIALFSKGQLSEAAQAFRAALDLNPDDTVAAKFIKYSESVKTFG